MNGLGSLRQMTDALLEMNEFMLLRFEEAKESGEDGDFYKEVKPFADRVMELAGKWEEASIAWLEFSPQKNLHPKQIISTAENIQMVSVQAFFPKTSRKRFIGHIQSIEYVLRALKSALKQEELEG